MGSSFDPSGSSADQLEPFGETEAGEFASSSSSSSSSTGLDPPSAEEFDGADAEMTFGGGGGGRGVGGRSKL